MTALYGVLAWLLLIVACTLAAAIAVGGLTLVHARFRGIDFVQHNEVGGFIIAVVGTLYAVLVAFVVAIVWQQFEGSESRAGVEAADAATVWHAAAGLPEPLGAQTRGAMVGFARTMIDEEWPAMRHGGESPHAEAAITGTIHAIARFRPADAGEANLQAQLLRSVEDLHDARHQRLQDNKTAISGFQWLVLDLGAIIVIGFCYLFGLQNSVVHRIMTGAVACMIASTFVLIFELDFPFRGDLAVSPEPWQTFLRSIGAL
ncbi:hypothetical protein WPS_14860 [Vulcanimicrobium alpinum]|uniref:DUF4239 domain-containing protein n=1 Tax=Vulcanimicrobium alpinum TaxID=3016050 RepID=A0AAN2C964_UNVUL|nr:DUF4239 domain-containing protein [Vulcanimicrobium alpinum]BDE06210.1 hypothetical protein WPS_14860 [Vulcanimicrobium alpinum]